MELNVTDILEPVNKELFKAKFGKDECLLFNKILFPAGWMPTTGIALLGTGENLSSFREQFYSMYYSGKAEIYDLGDLPKRDEDKLPTILKTLTENKVYTILVGGSVEASDACFDALIETGKKRLSASLVVPSVRQLPKFAVEKSEYLFNLNHLGYQTYLSNPETLESLIEKYYEPQRLGRFRENNKAYELPLRDSDMLGIDIASVKRSEANDSEYSGVNGLYAEEICRIGQYAGISENMKIVHLYCLSKLAENGQTSELFAQIIWHIVDGFANRKEELVLNSVNGIKKFIVKFKASDDPMVFYHSRITNRWWMEIESKSEPVPLIISCDRDDYEFASKGDIPTKWIWYQQKLTTGI